MHRGIVAEGFIKTGEQAHATIDVERRQAIRRNHTATHLLHRALREVLGTDTHQAGSLVAPDRLRFDFTSLDAMTPEQVARVSGIVSEQILASTPVETEVRPYAEAVEGGAMALFGEKYGDHVRVVTIGDFSKELCGGTHLDHTGQIGPFTVVSEGSVAAGVRRIEAVTGTAAIERGMRQQAVLESLAHEFRTPWTELPEQVAALREKLRAAEREVGKLRAELAGSSVGDLVESKVDVDGIAVVVGRFPSTRRAICDCRRPPARQARLGRRGPRRGDRRQTEPDRAGHPGRGRQGCQSGRSGARSRRCISMAAAEGGPIWRKRAAKMPPDSTKRWQVCQSWCARC